MHAVTKRFAATATGAALVAAWVVGGQGATLAQAEGDQQAPPAASGPDALAEQLLQLEDRFASRAIVNGAAYPSVQDVVEDNDDEKVVLDQLANVTRLHNTYDGLDGDFRSLYERAERAGGPVGGAVGDAARAWIVYGHGLELADEALNNDLVMPRETFDDAGVAIGADYAGGLVDAALRTIMESNDRLNLAHLALAGSPLDETLAAQFTDRTVEWESYREDDEPVYAALLSEPSTQVLVATERYVSAAAGTEARARSVEYGCVDRGVYTAVVPETAGDVVVEASDALGTVDQALDCPSLPPAEIPDDTDAG